MHRFSFAALAVFAPLAVAAAPPDPVDIVSVVSTDAALQIVHTPRIAGASHGFFKFDRARGSWGRIRAGAVYDAATRTYTDADVVLGREYCYRFTTRNAAGEATTGAQGCAVFDGGDASIRPPAPVENVAIVRSEPHLHVLRFTDRADNETGFEVLRRTANVAEEEVIAALPASGGVGAALTITDDAVDMEILYCYRVRALNEDGASLSPGACARTPPLDVAVPDVSFREGPQPFRITRPGEGALTLSWADPNFGRREWTVWLYRGSDARTPLASRRVRDRRTPRPPVVGATFPIPRPANAAGAGDPLSGRSLYCFRVTRGEAAPGDEPRLCESPHDPRTSRENRGPLAHQIPEIVRLRAAPGGLRVQLADRFGGPQFDVIRDDGKRMTFFSEDRDENHEIGGLTPEREYCVRAWRFNRYASRYGPLTCATTLPAENDDPAGGRIVTYGSRLEPQFPDQGLIVYLDRVEPGPPRPAKLLRVRVIGNIFSGYNVRFLKLKPGPVVCSLAEGDGVTVEPGGALTGAGLETLFGSQTPTIPVEGLALVACKILTDIGAGTEPIPISVTYQRPPARSLQRPVLTAPLTSRALR